MTTKVAPVETVYDALPKATEEPISPRLIAEVTGMGYSTVTRHLRALEAAGRAEKITPDEKGASVLWFATAARDLADKLKATYPADAEKIEQAYATVAAPAAAAPDLAAELGERYNADTGLWEPIADDPRPEDLAARDLADRLQAYEDAAPTAARELAELNERYNADTDRFEPIVDDPDNPEVWMATLRRGLEFHRRADNNLTGCGRAMRTGKIRTRSHVTGNLDARPCLMRGCWDDVPAADLAGPPLPDVAARAQTAAEQLPTVGNWPGDVDDLVDGDPSPISPAPTGGDMASITEWMEAESARPVSPASALATVTPPPAADPLTADEARTLTAAIRARVVDLLPLIKEAFTRRADLALNYASWSAYCDSELRGLRMPLQERQTATAALRQEGMSTRAIAGALGTSDATVRRDLRDAPASHDAPERVVGLDNKQYAPSLRRVETAVEVEVEVDPSANGADTGGGALAGEAAAGSTAPAPTAVSVNTPDTAVGVVPTGSEYESDPAARIAGVAEAAPGYVRVIEGEAVETPVDDPADPGPVPEPAPADAYLRARIDEEIAHLSATIGALAELLRDAGADAPTYLDTLRQQRKVMDLIVQAVEGDAGDA